MIIFATEYNSFTVMCVINWVVVDYSYSAKLYSCCIGFGDRI